MPYKAAGGQGVMQDEDIQEMPISKLRPNSGELGGQSRLDITFDHSADVARCDCILE